MTMERRHFELIARTIKESDAFQDAGEHEYRRSQFARDFADALESTNPNFDRERFLKACGATD